VASISSFDLALMLALVSPGSAAESADDVRVARAPSSALVVLPDLGTIRYHDPPGHKRAWFGVDGGGVAVPAAVSGIGRRVWSAYAAPTWALALLPRLALAGRHKLAWYDAGSVRLRIHVHELELSGRTLEHRPRLRDRPSFGVETHEVKLGSLDGAEFRLGGLRDVVLHLGYGLEHDLTPRLQLGWRVHARHAWVFRDTQRQGRVSLRLAMLPRERQRLALELVGYYVNRDPAQAGRSIPRHSLHGQVQGEYTWLGARGVGLFVGARYCTGFLSGEAPIYEIRSESLRAHYGEAFAGLRMVWE
jgi:hypothetical protein